MEGFQKSPYSNVEIDIRDSQWNTFKTIEVKLDGNSNFSGSFVLPEEVVLGEFSMNIHVKESWVKGSTSFRVEEYIKPTFKVSAKAKKADLLPGEKSEIELNASYYFGGGMLGAKGEWYVLSQNYFFDPKGYWEYQFGSYDDYFSCMRWGDCRYGDSYYTNGNFFTDAKGNYTLQHTFPKDAAMEQIYTFSILVQDPDTQKTVQQQESVILHTTDGYVGVKSNYRIDQKS